MKALFNATCAYCETFKPRCAKVTFTLTCLGGPSWLTLCEDCRKQERGRYHVASEHRSGKAKS